MSDRLKFDPDDPFFSEFSVNPIGISGGCFCCSKQIHINFENLEILPIGKINSSDYRVLICDDCEEDLNFLEETFKEKVDYDTLYFMQEEINEELLNSASPLDPIDTDLRKKCLVKVYNKYKNNLKGKLT
jgi:hypothetical protein